MKIHYPLLALVLGGCATTPPPPPSNMTSGVALENFDTSVRAQDDFYNHVNGKWLERIEIPADKSNYGSFTKLADEAETALRAIIEETAKAGGAEGSESKKIADLYNSFMDTEAIEKLGTKPLADELDRIAAVTSTTSLGHVFGHLFREGVRTPLYFYVNQDAKKSTEYIGYLHQAGLGLPDRDYYLKDDEKLATIREAYPKYIAGLMKLAGRALTPEQVNTIVAIEKKFAESHWTRVQNRDRDKTYNKLTLVDLEKKSPGFPWRAFFEGAKIPVPAAIVVRQPSFFVSLTDRMADVSIADWKLYLTFAVVDAAAPYLSQDFVDAQFAFRGRTLRGIEENRPRWKRGVAAVEDALGEAVAQIYVKRHFQPEAKARMKALVANLRGAFEVGINGLEWMGDDTKVEAQKKLEKFVSKIGYPDEWKSYEKLSIIPGDLVGNVVRAHAFALDRDVGKLGGPIDRNEWFMTPQTVNAYYNPPMNEIVFPAAILQPPFFDMAADDAVNYGAIGAVIGHELSHGFDDQGRKSDGDGNLRDWWTENDAKEFKARAQLMVDQYNQFVAQPPDGKVNGELTLGENIGDLGGLTIAYKAYKMSLDGQEAPVLDGFTGDQRFFLGWAQIWRRKYRDAELKRRLMTDPHSPSQFRVIGVLSNMPEFYEAFGVKEGDEMFRPEAERVKIW